MILVGDFNAKVGSDTEKLRGILGSHGISKCNANGELLLALCSEYNLVVTNTLFKYKDAYKMRWMHPRSKHWHLLDYIIVRQRDVMNVLQTRTLRRADCGANHVMLKTRLKVCRRNQHCGTGGKLPRKLDTCALKGQRKQKELTQKDWDSNNSEKDKDEKWATLKDICIKLRVMFEATLERNIKIGLMSMINI